MPSTRFVNALNEQVARELAAAQQYIAVAVHFDAQTLPQLARFFYGQAIEERNHAMMMVKYLLDTGCEARIPGIEPPETKFDEVRAPVAVALEQEKGVGEEIEGLAGIAREEKDYTSERFVSWFLKEQVEEVATMSALLAVVERAGTMVDQVEQYIARENPRQEPDDPTAPEAAGGTL